MLLWLYRLLFGPALLLLAPKYLLRMRRRGGYAPGFGDRFGAFARIPPRRPGVRRIWIQAVSVGEMLAIEPLLSAWAQRPDWEVVLTTTTSTGRALAEEKYAGLTLARGYFPLDAWWCMHRAWRWIRPDVAVLTEGERWPEFLAQARRRAVPVLCVNARLSDRSFRRMRRVRWAVPILLGGITRILAASAHDARRFLELGWRAEQVEVTGNLKLDQVIPRLDEPALAALRGSLGFPPDEPVLLGASTWPGEEAALLAAFEALRAEGRPARLLLVPRHAERRGEIRPLLEASGRRFHVRSTGPASGEVEIALADTTGELRSLTQLADVVFVGKSLPPNQGGQTPIEAAALGRPVLFGPEMSNFRPVAADLLAVNAAEQVATPAALAASVRRLWLDPARRATMGAAGAEWHAANRGALPRTLAAVEQIGGRAAMP